MDTIQELEKLAEDYLDGHGIMFAHDHNLDCIIGLVKHVHQVTRDAERERAAKIVFAYKNRRGKGVQQNATNTLVDEIYQAVLFAEDSNDR